MVLQGTTGQIVAWWASADCIYVPLFSTGTCLYKSPDNLPDDLLAHAFNHCSESKSHSWYLVTIGLVGMVQNAVLVVTARRPSRRGLPILLMDTITTSRVMDGLMDLESTIPGVGEFLRPYFFSDDLHLEEPIGGTYCKTLTI